MQIEVAERLAVHVESVKNWERGATVPTVHQIPRIIEFLGYDPLPAPTNLQDRLVYVRHGVGFTQESLAKALGVDPVTVYRWENGMTAPPPSKLQRLEELLSAKGETARR
jgi:transcriptional regulator with XRE-family HTH domain